MKNSKLIFITAFATSLWGAEMEPGQSSSIISQVQELPAPTLPENATPVKGQLSYFLNDLNYVYGDRMLLTEFSFELDDKDAVKKFIDSLVKYVTSPNGKNMKLSVYRGGNYSGKKNVHIVSASSKVLTIESNAFIW